MTYNVFGGTLNPAQSINEQLSFDSATKLDYYGLGEKWHTCTDDV